MASVGKRGNTYFVRYRIKDDLGNETMKRVSGFHTKEEAWEAARGLEAASNANINVHGDSMTCGELMERWFADHVLLSVQKTTASKYRSSIDVLAKMSIYSTVIKRLSPQAFSKFLVAMEQRDDMHTISPRTAMVYTEPIRLSIGWAVRNGILMRNPIQGYTKAPEAPRVQHILRQRRDINDLLIASKNKRMYVPVLLALYGGLRREECAGLKWDQVDFARNTISIVEAVTRTTHGQVVHKVVKSKASKRTLPMPAFVMDELRSRPKTTAYVCMGRANKPYSPDAFRQGITRLVKSINAVRDGTAIPPLPPLNFHDLRHTHAAMLIAMGVQPKVIQERLGHSSIKITMDLYGYLMTGLQEGVADMLQAFAVESQFPT